MILIFEVVLAYLIFRAITVIVPLLLLALPRRRR